MSGDSLVLQINGFNEENDINHTVFIFYDYTTKLFGIRGLTVNYENDEVSGKCHFSYDCGRLKHTISLINMIFVDSESEIFYATLNQPNLPLSSDQITYDVLSKTDDNNIISSTCVSNDEEFFNNDLRTGLKMLKNIYNEYGEKW
jgi:hypothetical protein